MATQAIIKIYNFNTVSSWITMKPKTILFLDIDDCLIESQCHGLLTCPNEKFTRALKHLINKKIFKTYKGKFMSYCNDVYVNLVKSYDKDLEDASWRLKDPTILPKFYEWQERVPVWGLTSRGLEISKYTERTLNHLGLRFQKSGFQYYQLPNITCGRTGMRTRRLVYCGGVDKGEVVKALGFAGVRRVVFIDDSERNLESVAKICKELNKDFVGLHYVKK